MSKLNLKPYLHLFKFLILWLLYMIIVITKIIKFLRCLRRLIIRSLYVLGVGLIRVISHVVMRFYVRF